MSDGTRLGSPPRVRSRLLVLLRVAVLRRITSACAEQTSPVSRGELKMWDHLRVCGADAAEARRLKTLVGSPPRVRSRLDGVRHGVLDAGITSACAEQTNTRTVCTLIPRDHLRVCGADRSGTVAPQLASGSPPRVRSRLIDSVLNGIKDGITSACAEQTIWSKSKGMVSWDHLRVCGADWG